MRVFLSRVDGERATRAETVLKTFTDCARAARVDEDANPNGRPLFTLFVNGDLKWVVAVPGSLIPGKESYLNLWRWRIQEYGSH